MPQAFFLKLSNIMFVAAAAAVPQNTFDSLYRPLGKFDLILKIYLKNCEITED